MTFYFKSQSQWSSVEQITPCRSLDMVNIVHDIMLP
jgi:hypothetical protein